MTPDPIPVVVDCDTGVDDALALLYLARRPEVDLVAVGSVHGNVDAPTAAGNTLQVLAVAGRTDVPVAVGALRPLAQDLATSGEAHAGDGLGGIADHRRIGAPVRGSAAEQLVRRARDRPGELSILATGPLTNLALALLLEPELPRLVERVVVMGGAFTAPGSLTAHAEANVFHDPEAADLVLGAGWPLTVVGLDVTMVTILDGDRLARLSQADTPAAKFSWNALQFYLDRYEQRLGRRACPTHDPLAAEILVDPGLASYERVAVSVELRSERTRGATLMDRRRVPGAPTRPLVSVAVTVDADRALDHLLDTLTTPG